MTNRRWILGVGGLVGVAVVAFLAFGVFGVQTLFTDDEVSEANPFDTAAASGLASDDTSPEQAEEMAAFMEENDVAAEVVADDEMPDMPDMPQVMRLIEGGFVDRSHPGEGTAVVLSDGGPLRFLRLEEDFATDNGPDLNVYLSAGVKSDGDAGLFDDDFIDLGNLKGNIGSQNYELASDVDLDRYNTVVIWCVRFGVAFTAADLS